MPRPELAAPTPGRDATWRVVATLGTAQTLAWASSFYLPALLAPAMARDTGVTVPTVFAAFSGALVISAAVGPAAGRAIDRRGGRPVLMATNGLFALGLVLLSAARGPWSLCAAWALLGVAMGSGLYEAAFAALVRLYGASSRNAITGITLIAGLASTVGWPLTSLMAAQFGWRGACLGWAALHLLAGLPLNAALPAAAPAPAPSAAAAQPALPPSPAPSPLVHPLRVTVLLSFFFATGAFIGTAMAAHLPRLLQAAGVSFAAAVAMAALVGPAQVAARLLEFGLLRRVHPLLAARLAAAGHPLGVAVLLLGGAPMAAAFALLHGAGNGMLTIARGTLPLLLFGPRGYGERQGWLMMPGRVASAAAPFAFGVALDRFGAGALWLSGAIGLAAFGALWALPHPREGVR